MTDTILNEEGRRAIWAPLFPPINKRRIRDAIWTLVPSRSFAWSKETEEDILSRFEDTSSKDTDDQSR